MVQVLPPEGGWVLEQLPREVVLPPRLAELTECLDNDIRDMKELFCAGPEACASQSKIFYDSVSALLTKQAEPGAEGRQCPKG